MFRWMLMHPKHSLKSSHLLFNAKDITYLHNPTSIVRLLNMNTASLISIAVFLFTARGKSDQSRALLTPMALSTRFHSAQNHTAVFKASQFFYVAKCLSVSCSTQSTPDFACECCSRCSKFEFFGDVRPTFLSDCSCLCSCSDHVVSCRRCLF